MMLFVRNEEVKLLQYDVKLEAKTFSQLKLDELRGRVLFKYAFEFRKEYELVNRKFAFANCSAKHILVHTEMVINCSLFTELPLL